ncbi:MAG TPA: hypothetical protein VG223_09840 [Solirubrobacteraceae bacterium]|jgi:hypothetical protein|nr:hypothetical protein [Solirubrobacteraceae bacterium]
MFRRLTAIAAVMGISALATAGPALAAASPTVTDVTAEAVHDTSATLHATINPNGASTIYYFQLGLTTAYGRTSAQRSAGHGSKPVRASTAATELLPGTLYHFRVIAQNAAGVTVGTDHQFTTAGPPPPGVSTGGATNVGRNSATLTGVVYPNNAATTYEFAYGPTPAFGMFTPQVTLPKGTTPVTVSEPISLLESGAVVYYQLLAIHAGVAPQGGGTMTFLTEPDPRPVPRLQASTQPRRARRAPYTLTTFGKLTGYPSIIPPADACTGTVKVRIFDGSKRVAIGFAPLQSDCSFSLANTFARLPGHGRRNRTVGLKVYVYFDGNGYVGPRKADLERVTLGRG